MSDEFVALAKLVARQAYAMNLAAMQLAYQAVLIEKTLPRCEKCRKQPHTVEHRHLHVKLCDRCAAESIFTSSCAYVDVYLANPDDPLNAVRQSLMDENDWLDTPDAEKVRHVVDYARIIKELEPSQVH